MVEWVGLSFPTLWANDTKHSQSNPSVPDRTDSNRESRETALLTKEMFLRTSSLLLLSTLNHSKKWSPSSSHPRGLFRSLASCDEVAGSSTIIQGVLTVATEPKYVSAQVVEWVGLSNFSMKPRNPSMPRGYKSRMKKRNEISITISRLKK